MQTLFAETANQSVLPCMIKILRLSTFSHNVGVRVVLDLWKMVKNVGIKMQGKSVELQREVQQASRQANMRRIRDEKGVRCEEYDMRGV